MWDLNKLDKDTYVLCFMFDLNYVGFKFVVDNNFLDSFFMCLIWTMWDLNSLKILTINQPSFVWSELCGI